MSIETVHFILFSWLFFPQWWGLNPDFHKCGMSSLPLSHSPSPSWQFDLCTKNEFGNYVIEKIRKRAKGKKSRRKRKGEERENERNTEGGENLREKKRAVSTASINFNSGFQNGFSILRFKAWDLRKLSGGAEPLWRFWCVCHYGRLQENQGILLLGTQIGVTPGLTPCWMRAS